MGVSLKFTLVAAWLMLGMGLAHAATKNLPTAKASRATAPAPVAPKDADGVAEARLIEIYTLIGKAQNRQALVKATSLVQDLPHFQLAQLVYGDLLTAQTRPIRTLGDMPDDLARRAPSVRRRGWRLRRGSSGSGPRRRCSGQSWCSIS